MCRNLLPLPRKANFAHSLLQRRSSSTKSPSVSPPTRGAFKRLDCRMSSVSSFYSFFFFLFCCHSFIVLHLFLWLICAGCRASLVVFAVSKLYLLLYLSQSFSCVMCVARPKLSASVWESSARGKTGASYKKTRGEGAGEKSRYSSVSCCCNRCRLFSHVSAVFISG